MCRRKWKGKEKAEDGNDPEREVRISQKGLFDSGSILDSVLIEARGPYQASSIQGSTESAGKATEFADPVVLGGFPVATTGGDAERKSASWSSSRL